MFFLAILCPPLAVICAGKPGQAMLNLFLCLLGWLPGVLHALFVIKDTKDAKRVVRYGAIRA